jgi:hypothetical protein
MFSVHNLLGSDKVPSVLYADKWPFLELNALAGRREAITC